MVSCRIKIKHNKRSFSRELHRRPLRAADERVRGVQLELDAGQAEGVQDQRHLLVRINHYLNHVYKSW